MKMPQHSCTSRVPPMYIPFAQKSFGKLCGKFLFLFLFPISASNPFEVNEAKATFLACGAMLNHRYPNKSASLHYLTFQE